MLIRAAENGHIPDMLLRLGIRGLVLQRLISNLHFSADGKAQRFQRFIADLKDSPLVLAQDEANEQHYQVPTEFFDIALGAHKKYSGCLWKNRTASLDEAESESLSCVAQRAELEDGQEILDLGCGWGSFSLWAAEKFPNARVLGLSNSRTQREYIETKAKERGFENLSIITSDISQFSIDRRFDRIVSIEMFEHMRNYEELLSRVRSWISDSGKLFVHVFCTKRLPYLFETEGASNWMGRYFFTGGMMPSFDLLPAFEKEFVLDQRWKQNGKHYGKTARAWLENIDRERERVLELFAKTYGSGTELMWFNRWRLFFMACEELFNFSGGNEWFVAHYLFSPRGREQAT